MKIESWFAVAAIIVGIIAAIQLWRLHKQKWNSNFSDADLKSMWGNGAEMFAEEWILDLRVKVPRVDMELDFSLPQFFEQLSHYHSIAKTAMDYFSDGTYLIKRDGSMCKIVDGKIPARGYIEVNSVIDFEELPHYHDVLEHHLKAKPVTAMERAKNCVLLDVHAHGTGKRAGKVEFVSMPRFAARDGKVIVESY